VHVLKLALIGALLASPAAAREESRKTEWLQCQQRAEERIQGVPSGHVWSAYVIEIVECMSERGYALDRDRCPAASSIEFWCWKEWQ
jgi:hypothetical protein